MRTFLPASSLAIALAGCIGVVENENIPYDGGSGVTTSATAGTTNSSVATGDNSSATSTSDTSTSSSASSGSVSSTTSGSTTGSTVTGSTGAGGATGSSAISAGAGGSVGGSDGSGGRAGAGGNGGMGGRRPDGGSTTTTTTAGAGGSRADAGIGGAGGMGGNGVGGPTFARVKSIISKSCGNCHSNFTSYATFTSHAVSQCGADTLAKANDAANSAFLELVQGQCSILMPRGCSKAPCIAQSDIDTVAAWINAGALNN